MYQCDNYYFYDFGVEKNHRRSKMADKKPADKGAKKPAAPAKEEKKGGCGCGKPKR